MSEYYDVAFNSAVAVNPVAKNHPWATWPAVAQLKALFYRAIAQYYMSVTAQRETHYGEQVGFAFSLHLEVIKLIAAGLPSESGI